MRDKFICRFQDSSNQSIVAFYLFWEYRYLPPCRAFACWFNICQIFVDNLQNSRAGFQALMSYHAAVCPMTCQPEQDGDICLRSRHQLRPRGIWSNRSGKYSRWSAVPSWNRFSGPAVETNKVTLPLRLPTADWPRNTGWSLVVPKQHCFENAVISYFGDARLVNYDQLCVFVQSDCSRFEYLCNGQKHLRSDITDQKNTKEFCIVNKQWNICFYAIV